MLYANGSDSGHVKVYQDIATAAPTTAPSPNPTKVPTVTPTIAPTTQPTFVPAERGSFEINSIESLSGIATSDNTIELNAFYNASNREHSTIVLSPNCIDPFPGTAATAFSVITSDDESLGNGVIAFNNTIEIDISKINGTEWFQALPNGDYGGIIDLCLEAAVYLSLNGVEERMNFINTNVTLTVEMDANFEVVSVDAERKDADEEDVGVDYSDYIQAYQCDSASPDTPLVAPFPTYTQGSDLTICIRGTDADVTDVSSINSLAVSQAGGTSSPFIYVAEGSSVDLEVASVECDQGSTAVCVADLKLLGRFFSVENPGDLTVSGEVLLDFGDGSSSTTRRLSKSMNLSSSAGGEGISSSRRRAREEEEIEGFSLKNIKLGKSGDESSSFFFFDRTIISTLVGALGVASMLLVF